MKQTVRYRSEYVLSFAEYGDKGGFPILVQHGLIASSDDYHLFDSLLKAEVRLICIARPGYGDSSPYSMGCFSEWAEIVAPLIDELKLPQFDVLGLSSGAPYSYALGHGFPEKIRHIYIFSGVPALYDEVVRSLWPYELATNPEIAQMEKLAHELFFSPLTSDDRKRNDIRDSMMNNAFGVAQDLRLRALDWGFRLSEIQAPVFMRHSKCDDSVPYETALRTANILPNCILELTETGSHFSEQALDDFLKKTILNNTMATR